eukprot:3216497-Rhodomonas_salina.2
MTPTQSELPVLGMASPVRAIVASPQPTKIGSSRLPDAMLQNGFEDRLSSARTCCDLDCCHTMIWAWMWRQVARQCSEDPDTASGSPFPSARWRHTAVAVDRTKVRAWFSRPICEVCLLFVLCIDFWAVLFACDFATQILIFGGSGPARNAPRLNDLWGLKLKRTTEDMKDQSISQSPSNLMQPYASPGGLASVSFRPEEVEEELSMEWSIVPAHGKPPAPRSDHSAVREHAIGLSCLQFRGVVNHRI